MVIYLKCIKVSAVYRGRALPLAYEVYKPHRKGIDKLVLKLLRRVAAMLPRGGREREVKELAPHKGAFWAGRVKAFKKAKWRDVNVAAVWEQRCEEPWLLVTDRPATYARCRGYAKRIWCEQMHRDEKSCGFHWGDRHVDDPDHAGRLILVIALAMLLATSVGSWLLKTVRRPPLDGCARRLHSLFQMGLRWIHDCLTNNKTLPAGLYLYPA